MRAPQVLFELVSCFGNVGLTLGPKSDPSANVAFVIDLDTFSQAVLLITCVCTRRHPPGPRVPLLLLPLLLLLSVKSHGCAAAAAAAAAMAPQNVDWAHPRLPVARGLVALSPLHHRG